MLAQFIKNQDKNMDIRIHINNTIKKIYDNSLTKLEKFYALKEILVFMNDIAGLGEFEKNLLDAVVNELEKDSPSSYVLMHFAEEILDFVGCKDVNIDFPCYIILGNKHGIGNAFMNYLDSQNIFYLRENQVNMKRLIEYNAWIFVCDDSANLKEKLALTSG